MTVAPLRTNMHVAYVPGIDSLRAVAVLSVMLYHLRGDILPGGFTGVDIFFVISGYVVSASLARDAHEHFWKFLGRFYSRRLIRIYPALLTCLMVTFALAVLFIPSSWLSTATSKTGILAFFGLSNFALLGSNDGYFSPRVEFNAFTHTWSLGVEEQFYLGYPILFFAALRWQRSHRHLAIAALALPAIASFACSAWASIARPEWAFYQLPSRFWELAIGGLLFQLHQRGTWLPKSDTAANIALTGGLLLISLGFVGVSPEGFPFPWAILPVAGAASCIAAAVRGSQSPGTVTDALANSVTVYVGKASYSLYLWHWPVYVLFRWTIGLDGPLNAVAAVALVILLAVGSYQWIELPLRRGLPRLGQSDVRLIGFGWTLVGICSCCAVALIWLRPILSLSVVTREAHEWYPLPEHVVSRSARAESEEFHGRHLFVVGDSHVAAYALLLRRIEQETGLTVRTFWSAGCTAASLIGPVRSECSGLLESAVEQIGRNASPGDVVFLPGLRVNRLSDQWASFDGDVVLSSQNSQQALDIRASALRDADTLLARLQRTGVRVLFEAPKPVFASPPFRCSDWFNAGNPICRGGLSIERSRLLALSRPTLAAIEILRERHPDLLVWDPFPLLCPQDVCRAIDDERRPLFFDGDHLSARANHLLYDDFLLTLRRAFELEARPR